MEAQPATDTERPQPPANRSNPEPLSREERLLKAAEAQLLRSPTYRKALEGFKEMFGDAAYAAQMMMHSVNREAMRLAVETALSETHSSSQDTVSPSRRAIYLYRLGQYLRSHRRRQGFSLAQIHHLTQIPLPHLHALESGHVSRFPQSHSYLYGSIQLWGNALGLNGAKLAAGIPPANATPCPRPRSRPVKPPPPPISKPPQEIRKPQPQANTKSQPQANKGAIAFVSWRYLMYGTPIAATVGLLLWLINFLPSALRPVSQNSPEDDIEREEPTRRRPAVPYFPSVQEPSSAPISSSPTVWEGMQTNERLTISPPEELRRRRD